MLLTIAIFGSLVLLMLIGIPIAFSMLIVATVLFLNSMPDLNMMSIAVQRVYHAIMSFPLLAIPFFIFVGLMMNRGGVTNRMLKLARDLVGHLPGSLGHVNVVASIIFAGMSGSAVADAAGLGAVEIEMMKREGYDAEFSAAVTAASSTIGPVIPPSIPFVIYGWLTGVSVSRLFLAGVVPGILMGLFCMVLIYFIARKRNFPRYPQASFRSVLQSFIQALPPLFTLIIIVGGIIIGLFTPTEAAAVGSFYAFVLTVFIYKEANFKDVLAVCRQTVELTAKILFVIASASFFGWMLTRMQIPNIIANTLLGISDSPTIIMLLIVLLLLILGCFIEGIALMLMIMPILVLTCNAFGIDLIYFGVVVNLCLMIGLVTPPLGLSLYATAAVADVEFVPLCRAITPFLLMLLLCLLIIVLVPQISLFVPCLIC